MEIQTVRELNSFQWVASVQSRTPLALDTLVVLEKKSGETSVRELNIELENISAGKRISRSVLLETAYRLALADLVDILPTDGSQLPRITPLGRASLSAYRAYEQALVQPIIDNFSKRFDFTDGGRLAKAMLFTPLFGEDRDLEDKEDEYGNNVYRFVLNSIFHPRSFYGLPAVLSILKAQGIWGQLSMLIERSRSKEDIKDLPDMPFADFGPDFRVISEHTLSIKHPVQILRRADLLETDNRGYLNITDLGQSSLKAINDYYAALKPFVVNPQV